MKDIDDVLTGFEAIYYFLDSNDGVEDIKPILKSESYNKSIRRHLVSILPSLAFVISLSVMLLIMLTNAPDVEAILALPAIIIGVIVILFYIIYIDVERYLKKHDKFIIGKVVGNSKNDDNIKTRYYLILEIGDNLVCARTSKQDYLDAKLTDNYYIFLEGEGLCAVKK